MMKVIGFKCIVIIQIHVPIQYNDTSTMLEASSN